jgi:hypothetical protein
MSVNLERVAKKILLSSTVSKNSKAIKNGAIFFEAGERTQMTLFAHFRLNNKKVLNTVL